MNDDAQLPAREFFARFIDDYYADCDEHLQAARRGLVELERQAGASALDRELLEELFRNFHTIKGLSGMVSLVEAETLAHAMESYLAALRRGQVALTAAAAQELEAGVQTLEAVIAARRANAALPDIEAVRARLAALLLAPADPKPLPLPPSRSPAAPPAGPPGTDPVAAPVAGLPPELAARLAAAVQSGAQAWHFEYVPTAELAARGLTVEAIRARLREVGEILQVRPRVQGGGVVFDFIVTTRAGEEAFAEWAKDGLRWRAVEVTAAFTPAEPSRSAPPESPARPASAPGISPRTAAPSNVVRVDLARLDELMRLVGELVTSRARLADQLRELGAAVSGALGRSLQETNLHLERQLRELREGIMRVRLVPIGEAFERMQFVVRDLVRETGRDVRVELSGQRTEIDKLVVERMMDPLLHLVRNAVSHGLESPAERRAAGKPPEGRLSLSATTAGDAVVLQVADDGRGVNHEEVTRRAREMGLIGPEAVLDDATLLEVLCAPGFSTRDAADLAAGRGVGMSVVRATVQELGGHLSLETEPGRGTRFTIQLPVTLLIVDALIVAVGRQTLAIPQPALREVLQVDPAAVRKLERNEVLPYRSGVLPLIRLSRLFHWEAGGNGAHYALVVGSGHSAAGLVVDRIIGQREIVVRALTDPLVRTPGIAGATELSDGRVILILDAAALVRTARRGGGANTPPPAATVIAA